jgi:hypothetical protein
MFLQETDDPSAAFLRKEELRARLTQRLVEILESGRWVVSGRTGAPSRQDLEPVDWRNAAVDFDTGTIGWFQHIEVRERRRETSREILQHFIERLCDAAESPGKPLTKDVIERLAGRMFPEDFSFSDFDVAWKEANIGAEWYRRGPKRKSESH